MNQLKSCIYFGGVKEDVVDDILRLTGMSQGQLSFRYLGVPLSSKKLTIIQCMPLIKKIMARVDCWATKMLSYAWRVQLIKSVLFGIQVYWSQIFLLPQKVLKLIQTACRTFLWTRKSAVSKRALVAWDKVSLPKSAGGLGLLNLSLWNKAAICKLCWNLARKKDKIWIKWVHGFYIKERDIEQMPIPIQCSWIIKKILGARAYGRDGNGDQDWMRKSTFSIKQVYRNLQGAVQQVEWRRLMTNNAAPPKCIFISWLLLHKGLATCEYLQRIGISVDQNCCFCEQSQESIEHLFFGCDITGEIWEKVTEWCGMRRRKQEWCREKQYLLSQCTTKNGKQLMYRCTFSVTVYLIWKERNARRLQGKITSVEGIVHQCKSLLAWCGNRHANIGALLFR